MSSDQQVHEQLPNVSVERSDAVTSTGTFARRRPADLVEPNVDVAIPAIEFRNVFHEKHRRSLRRNFGFDALPG